MQTAESHKSAIKFISISRTILRVLQTFQAYTADALLAPIKMRQKNKKNTLKYVIL